MKKKNILLSLCAITALSSSLHSFADSYVGVSFGSADYSSTNVVQDAVAAAGTTINATTITESASGNKFYYGYEFTPSWALELSYADLGKAGSSGSGLSGAVNVNYDSAVDVSSLGLAAVYNVSPGEKFNPYLKLGINRWDTDSDFQVTASLAGAASVQGLDSSNSGTDLLFAVGIDGDITDSLLFRFEIEKYDMDDPIVQDVTLISAGLGYKF